MLPETDARIARTKDRGVSVVICCYNSASRISETLRHLANQKVADNTPWEIILVDNGSNDNTQEVAKKAWLSERCNVPLKLVQECKPGLSYARDRGIAEANFDIIIFCDDDNLLCDTYVQTAHRIMTADPNIGIAGGWCEADTKKEVDKWIIPFLPALAIGKPADKSSYLREAGKCLNGAGMVMRRTFYNLIKEKGFYSLLDDRKHNTLSSGGDTELCWAMMYAGYEIYFDDSLFFKHVIPPTRLNKDYFIKLTLSTLYPVIILNIYSFLFKNDSAGFTRFIFTGFLKRTYALLYFLPRLCFGKYPLYCSVVFRQNLKIIGLSIYSLPRIKNDFIRIRDLKQQLVRL